MVETEILKVARDKFRQGCEIYQVMADMNMTAELASKIHIAYIKYYIHLVIKPEVCFTDFFYNMYPSKRPGQQQCKPVGKINPYGY